MDEKLDIVKSPCTSSSSPVPKNQQISTTITDVEAAIEPSQEWKAQKAEYLVIFTLAIISVMVALDATILVSVLPVRIAVIKPSQYFSNSDVLTS